MSRVSLPSRQRLSRRVQFFGDASSYRNSLHNRSDLTQWEKLIMLDPESQSVEFYMAHHDAAPDLFPLPIPAEYLQYVNDMGGGASQTSFQPAPVTQPTSNVGVPNPPATTDAEYAAMVEKNKADADALARQNALRSAPAFQPDPEPTPVKTDAPVTTDMNLNAPEVKTQKSSSLILPAIAGIAAFLILKG